MSSPYVQSEIANDIATLTLTHPPSMNAFNSDRLEQLNAAVDQAAETARVIVLTGAGKAFCTGWQVDPAEAPDPNDDGFDAGASLEQEVNPFIKKLRDLDVPLITSVRGPAAGGGISIALSGDLIVASDTARFIQVFSRIGLVPDAGASYFVTRAIGRARAMELSLLGGELDAQTALDWGLINRVVSDEDLEAETQKLAIRLAEGPMSLALTRKLIHRAVEHDLDHMLDAEVRAQRIAGMSEDVREGAAAFAEKRRPNFIGR